MRRQRTLSLRNDLAELQRLADAVREFGEGNRLPAEAVYDARLALEEAVVNIITHGYDDRRRHRITVRLSLRRGEMVLEVEDDGKPFNPLSLPPPDTMRPLDQRTPGGFGVHLVRSVVDSLEYRREGGKNILVMKKRTPG
jgi:anti-sigma regulatory factor (Ser/Thr protein kinase)